jgi:O-succinylbenzoic acid--CoA ligase
VIKAPKITDDIIFTNDVVQLISDKQFNWLGRFDNVINSGGIKLQPEVIENKLSNVLTNRFFVNGFPDEYLGEKLVLIIEGKETKINFTKSNLTKYEVPKTIYFLDKFIETETGKVNRKQTKLLLEK